MNLLSDLAPVRVVVPNDFTPPLIVATRTGFLLMKPTFMSVSKRFRIFIRMNVELAPRIGSPGDGSSGRNE
jgi:hypothetical protein